MEHVWNWPDYGGGVFLIGLMVTWTSWVAEHSPTNQQQGMAPHENSMEAGRPPDSVHVSLEASYQALRVTQEWEPPVTPPWSSVPPAFPYRLTDRLDY